MDTLTEIRIHTHIHTHTHTHIHKHTNTQTHKHTHVNTHTQTHIPIFSSFFFTAESGSVVAFSVDHVVKTYVLTIALIT